MINFDKNKNGIPDFLEDGFNIVKGGADAIAKAAGDIGNNIVKEIDYDGLLNLIDNASKLPMVHVNREEFLRSTFKDDQRLEEIIKNGPHSIYSTDELLSMANGIIDSSTKKTAAASFATGIASNPVLMVATGGADIAQYFGFSLNLCQKIAYLFGEDELFNGDVNSVSEENKVRLIAYLGAMFGAGGAASLISWFSKNAAKQIGKKVASKALTKTLWYPIVNKVGTLVGKNITKQTVGKIVTKALPIIGGVISSTITYVTFKPLGNNLAQMLADNINGTLKVDENVIDVEITEKYN